MNVGHSGNITLNGNRYCQTLYLDPPSVGQEVLKIVYRKYLDWIDEVITRQHEANILILDLGNN